MKHQKYTNKRRAKLFDIEVYDPRKCSYRKKFTHRGLTWEEVEWIKFHPYLKITSVRPAYRRKNNDRPKLENEQNTKR